MYYGSSIENDMDMGQFVIMFQAIFQEGMFRPGGSIKDFLDLLLTHYKDYGGTLRTKSQVSRILSSDKKVNGVELANGEEISCDYLLSTIGSEETFALLNKPSPLKSLPRLGFVETIFEMPRNTVLNKSENRTIIFYNSAKRFLYQQPETLVDFNSGVVCMPQNFQDLPITPSMEVRTTHLANYEGWSKLKYNSTRYKAEKNNTAISSLEVAEKIVGNFGKNIVYRDTFTPITIERFTAKKQGAIYGNPVKIKDGDIGY